MADRDIDKRNNLIALVCDNGSRFTFEPQHLYNPQSLGIQLCMIIYNYNNEDIKKSNICCKLRELAKNYPITEIKKFWYVTSPTMPFIFEANMVNLLNQLAISHFNNSKSFIIMTQYTYHNYVSTIELVVSFIFKILYLRYKIKYKIFDFKASNKNFVRRNFRQYIKLHNLPEYFAQYKLIVDVIKYLEYNIKKLLHSINIDITLVRPFDIPEEYQEHCNNINIIQHEPFLEMDQTNLICNNVDLNYDSSDESSPNNRTMVPIIPQNPNTFLDPNFSADSDPDARSTDVNPLTLPRIRSYERSIISYNIYNGNPITIIPVIYTSSRDVYINDKNIYYEELLQLYTFYNTLNNIHLNEAFDVFSIIRNCIHMLHTYENTRDCEELISSYDTINNALLNKHNL